LSVVAAILPENVYVPGAISEYRPPLPAEPYAVPLVDSVPVVELIAVIFAPFA
jgi:hypothetical protein